MIECNKECELYPMTEGCIECRHYQLELLRKEELIRLVDELVAEICKAKQVLNDLSIDPTKEK